MIIWTLKLFCNPRQRCTDECRGALKVRWQSLHSSFQSPRCTFTMIVNWVTLLRLATPPLASNFSSDALIIITRMQQQPVSLSSTAWTFCSDAAYAATFGVSIVLFPRPESSLTNTALARSALYNTAVSSSKFHFMNPRYRRTHCFILKGEWSGRFLWTCLSSHKASRNLAHVLKHYPRENATVQ